MNINQYEYLWASDNYDYVLVRTKLGYLITNRITEEILLIENEILENRILNQMLQHGVPIYQSQEDLKDNCSPINIVGQPVNLDVFPVRRYRVYIEWSKEIPLILQIKEFKNTFLKENEKSNQALLDIARNSEKWQFDILYLDESEKKKMIQLAEKHNLKVIFELDELKERF